MHFAALHNDEDSKIHFIIVIQQIWEVLLKSCSTIIENYFSEPYRAILYYTVKQQFNKYCSVIFISRYTMASCEMASSKIITAQPLCKRRSQLKFHPLRSNDQRLHIFCSTNNSWKEKPALIITCPSKAWIALEASSLEVNVTKPKPLDLFCSRSTMTLAAKEYRNCQINILPCTFLKYEGIKGRERANIQSYDICMHLYTCEARGRKQIKTSLYKAKLLAQQKVYIVKCSKYFIIHDMPQYLANSNDPYSTSTSIQEVLPSLVTSLKSHTRHYAQTLL